MARLTKSLSRLATVAVGVTALGAGLAPAATAATYVQTGSTVTGVQINPGTNTENVNICEPFTVLVNTSGPTPPASVTIEIKQTATLATGTTSLSIEFCSPSGSDDNSRPFGIQQSPGNDATATGNGCSKAGTAGQTVTAACQGAFFDQNGNNKFVIGVKSNQAGTMDVHAWADQSGDGTDSTSGEPGFTAKQTWVSADPKSNNNHITCDPASDTNPTATTHSWKCVVTDNAGRPISGATVRFEVTAGPDDGTSGACSGTTSDDGGGTPGQTGPCSYENTGQTGHDVIAVWVETSTPSNTTQNNGEPSTTITKDWVAPAPNGSSLTMSCSPNQTNTTGSNASCQETTSTKNVTITATVKDSSSQPVSGVIVTFDQPTDASPSGKSDTGDTESVSPTSCSTNAQGQCSTQFTDSSPSDGEKFTVTAHLARQGQSEATATTTITYHNPNAADARNISVSPETTTQSAGKGQQFTATVTDRFGNRVPGATIDWTEAGPGAFPNGATTAHCVTGADGTCSIGVVSNASDRGEETVTGTIANSNYPSTNNKECTAPAGKTYVSPSSSSGAGDAPGAPAGNCSDAGKVTWTEPPPPPAEENPTLDCWSPKAHVLKCKMVSHPRVAGADVTFRKVHKDGTYGKIIAQQVTNDRGVAKFRLAHLKSGKLWRVIARLHKTETTKAAYSNVDKARIK